MERSKNIVYITLFALLILDCNALKCQQQVCRECPRSTVDGSSREVTCDVKNIVSTSWLGNVSVNLPDPPSDLIEFACIKMTATNKNINGDSTDVLRGCTLYVGAEYMCQLLVGVELARGKTETKCNVCHRDNCNGASVAYIFMPLLLLTAIIMKINYY